MRLAWDEGEGDRTRDRWLDVHRRYFARQASREGFEIDDDIPTVFERFETVWPLVGERTPRLERPGMLKKLKFEAEARGSQPEVRRVDFYDRGAPNMRSDQPLCLGDRASINGVVRLDVHGSTPRTWITQSVLAVTGAMANIPPNETITEASLWQNWTERLRL
jgi:hypothetical protein